MGWLIALAVIILLAVLPLGVSAKYDEDGAVVKIIAGPVRFKVYPQNKKASEKPKKAKKKSGEEKKPAAKTEAGTQKKKGGSAADFLPLVRLVFDLLGDFRRKLRVDLLELKVILAGDDPCDLAVNYGRACASLASLEPQLSRFFVIQKKDLDVECDFTEDKTLIIARLDLTITIGRLFSLGFRHGIRILREFLRIMKLRKGGAT